MDKFGWVMIAQLIGVLDINRRLRTNCKEDNKILLYSSKTKIRASQGHSSDVDVQPIETKPPSILFHGTATRF
jgi:putative RNA 2'-phosphotransferase